MMNKKKSNQSKKKQAMRRSAQKRSVPREPEGAPPSIFAGMTIEWKWGSFVPGNVLFDGLGIYRGNIRLDAPFMVLNLKTIRHIVCILDSILAELFEYSAELPDQVYLMRTNQWSHIRMCLYTHQENLEYHIAHNVLDTYNDGSVSRVRNGQYLESYIRKVDNEYVVAVRRSNIDMLTVLIDFENAVALDRTVLSHLDADRKRLPTTVLYSPWMQMATETRSDDKKQFGEYGVITASA